MGLKKKEERALFKKIISADTKKKGNTVEAAKK